MALSGKMLEGRTAREQAWARARRAGMRTRGIRSGSYFELVGFENNHPLYYQTLNEKAAISTATDLVLGMPVYDLTGAGVIVGVWDAGNVRATHEEFGGLTSRISQKTSEPNNAHATHVAGTIAAQGEVAQAKGMAPEAEVWSYHMGSYGTSDYAQMGMVGATEPGQSDRLYLSNHSYGYSCGWVWYGPPEDSNSIVEYVGGASPLSQVPDEKFGRYGPATAAWDSICHSCPYYLPFKAAGNDRDDEAPSLGRSFYRWEVAGSNVYQIWYTYDPCEHPPADGAWLGGYDTIPDVSTAKNIMTVGAVDDAVTGFARDLSEATMPEFSGWGPTDDGRIKPDIVANGMSLYSPGWDSSDPGSATDTSYWTQSGTSMAAPNACGSAALLVQLYGQLFPGQAMLSSTLKALIIHTADDLGNAGPDYVYGWGLMNAKSAADLIIAHHGEPLANMIYEEELDGPEDLHRYTFIRDGDSDVRVTLCWTDIPGTSTLLSNDPSRKLVRDLDVRVMDANGTLGEPYVLDKTNPDWPATRGDNQVDNVERIDVDAALLHSVFTVQVSVKPNAYVGSQRYSLIVTGQEAQPHPVVIKGRVVSSETAEGVPGVVLSGEPGGLSVETDSQGYYEMMVPLGWKLSPLKGSVVPAKYAHYFEPAGIDYNDITMDVYGQNYTAVEIRPVISGMIWDDSNMPVSGVRIGSDPNSASVFSDPNGAYALTVPYGYTGTVSASKSATAFQPPSRYYQDVTVSVGDQNYDAMGIFHSISGRVVGPGNRGIAGVRMVVDPNDGEVLTDDQGNYHVDVLEHFTGAVEPLKYGYILQPTSIYYTDITEPFDEQDYTVGAVFYDGFSDDAKGAAWVVENAEPNALHILEQGQRLNVMAVEPNNTSVFYRANRWKIDPNQPFTMKVDFHLGLQDAGEPNSAWLTFGIEDGTGDFATISAGCSGAQRYYAFAALADGNSFSAQTARTVNSGTLYITGDPAAGAIYVSYTDYGQAEAWQTLQCAINGCVGRDVRVSLGGGGYGVTLAQGQAWLDNIEIDTGLLNGWPPTTDIDQDGYIGWGDLWYVANHWLEYYLPADINKDGKVNFRDFALIVVGW